MKFEIEGDIVGNNNFVFVLFVFEVVSKKVEEDVVVIVVFKDVVEKGKLDDEDLLDEKGVLVSVEDY